MRSSDWSSDVCSSDLPCDHDLEELAGFINNSSRVTLLCGAGCAGAHDELMKLGETILSPIVHALRGKEHVEYDNPFDVGMTGLIGFASGYYAMEESDLLLMLGTDFPYKDWFPKNARIVQRSEEHTSELQSLMRISYAVFCLKKK